MRLWNRQQISSFKDIRQTAKKETTFVKHSAMCVCTNLQALNLKRTGFSYSKIPGAVLCFWLLALPLTLIAQTKEIDSLKKLLPLTQDSAKVDCLNDLGGCYAISINSLNWDTALIYLNQAYKEALRLDYITGIAFSLYNLASMEMSGHHFSAAERYLRKSILYFEKAGNNPALNQAHSNLGYVLYAQGDFDKAIAEFQTSILFFQKPYQEWEGIVVSKCLEFLGVIYGLKGELEKGFELAQKGLAESQQRNDSLGMAFPLLIIGDLYQNMGDHPMALEYYYSSAALGGNFDIYLSLQIAAVHNAMQRYDSALYYYQKGLVRDPANNYAHIVLGEIYLQQKKYNEALLIFKKAALFLKKNNGRKELLRVFPDIAKVYVAQKKYPAALYYAQEGLALAQTIGARQYIADDLELLSAIYGDMGINESAFFYLKKYMTLKDSLLSDQFKANLFAYRSVAENEKKQAQIEGLKKEKQINQQQLTIKEQQLKEETLLKKFLTGSLLAFALLSVIILRNITLKRRNEKQRLEHDLEIQKLESEKAKSELNHQATELEMLALRAQMNPHFIFNSLNSINRFILQNNKAQASEYLTKFSKLVRLILQNSQASLITLENELESLGLYLDLESLRFEHHFSYEISIAKDLDIEVLKVPPLIIQPYAENAIWHGLMHKEDKGHLQIVLYQEEELLCYKITDDGIGRKKAAELKSKSVSTHKSMGMRITAERIAILQQKTQLHNYIRITDLMLPDSSAGGTEVLLKIPVHYG